VFRITTAGVLTVLHTFSGTDGYDPNAGLAVDAEGDLFGTTFSGGSSNDGVVFEISAEDTETVLHSFSGSDGATPYSGLIIRQQGDLYGTQPVLAALSTRARYSRSHPHLWIRSRHHEVWLQEGPRRWR
jgi:uncharacterized repeat protein (TIGR03803 family)